jgi:hypothetical protein
MSNKHNFKIGDIVISKYGKYPFTINYIGHYETSGKYLHNGNSCTIDTDNLIHYEPEETIMETKTLYSFTDDNGTTVFGTHIGTNSSNQYIIEIKGGGGIVIKDQKDLEEVLPYTFSVTIAGKELHYIGEPGKLTKGDILIHTPSAGRYEVVVVGAVDTKNKTARSKFKGRKLVTESI